jgi:rhomboid protease GluP
LRVEFQILAIARLHPSVEGGGMAGQFGKRGVVRPMPSIAAASVAVTLEPRDVVLPKIVPRAPVRAFSAKPISTVLILLLLALVYSREGVAPSLHTQLALGALNPNAVWQDGEWWRLFTAPLMHGSLSHITGNAIVLAIIGFVLEPLIGSAWFAAIFFVGALGGALGSLFYNASHIVGTGASGAILALVAATFVFSLHDKASPRSSRMQIISVRLVVPAILPMFTTASSHIDCNAHAGGALAGIVMGLVLMLLWPPEEARPSGRPLALAIVLVSLMASSFGFWKASITPPHDAVTVSADGLIPEASVPTDTSDGVARSADLVAHYPRDPRAHLFRGMHFLKINDIADASEQFRTAFEERGVLGVEAGTRFETAIRLLYAATLLSQGQRPEAADIARPACADTQKSERLSGILTYLRSAQICAN